MDLLAELDRREMLYDSTDGLPEALREGCLAGYVGFDPTASSLHVGNLLPIMGLARLQRGGHSPIALVGGGTGLIGDPSGKIHERQLLDLEQVEHNLQGIRRQLEKFLDFEAATNPARIVNNADWLCEIGFIEFLRDVGKHFSVSAMLNKESVRQRIGQEEGISFTEFSYMLLQSYDFHVLNQRYGCTLQMGGSDQWGNITAGIDLVRRMSGHKAFGVVFPLVTNASGLKFGKTEAGTVWLDPEATSPYRFYQFWLNTDDRDVIRYLNFFTWLNSDEIEALREEVESSPEQRTAQKRLAREVTSALHGADEAGKAERASRVLFGGELKGLGGRQIEEIFSEVPSTSIEAARLDSGIPLLDLLSDSGLAKSRKEARRLIEGGGVYLNNIRVNDLKRVASRDDCVDGRFLVLRKGSRNYHLVRVD